MTKEEQYEMKITEQHFKLKNGRGTRYKCSIPKQVMEDHTETMFIVKVDRKNNRLIWIPFEPNIPTPRNK